jgi:putative acetyltransferase
MRSRFILPKAIICSTCRRWKSLPSVSSLHGTAVRSSVAARWSRRTAEIKRMFVDPEARGLKIASRLMNALEALAAERKLVAIQLETGIYQPEAIALYRKYGYVEIEPFGSYQPDPLSLFMEKRLA